MTIQKNRPLIALPNVLRDQTVPNTLGGVRPPPDATARPRPSARPAPSARAVALGVGIVIALAWILMGRGA